MQQALRRSEWYGLVVLLCSSVAVALSAAGMTPTGFPWTPTGGAAAARETARLLGLVGVVGTLVGWLLLRHLPRRWHWPVLGGWTLPVLLAPPVLSKDMYAYAEQGWLVAQGLNPYFQPMSSVGGPFAKGVDTYWQLTTVVYPPLALEVQRWVVELSGANPYWSVIAMRVPALLGVVLVGLGIPRIARALGRDERLASWGALLNPLVLLHFIGGGHNDALATGLAVAAVWVAVALGPRWRTTLLGGLLAGAAMAIKQPLALAIVPAAILGIPAEQRLGGWPVAWRKVIGRLAVGTAVVVATFAAITLATGLGLGWLTGSGAPYTVGTDAPAYILGFFLSQTGLVTITTGARWMGYVTLAIGLALMAWAFFRWVVGEPVRFLAWALVAFAIFSPSLQPWYLLWGGLLLPAVPMDRRVRAFLVGIVVWSSLTVLAQEYFGIFIVYSALSCVVPAWLVGWWTINHWGEARAELEGSVRPA